MTTNELLAKATSKEVFNTNNDWGFGGAIGTQYVFKNNVQIRTGKACYRHLPSAKFVAVYHNSKRIIDTAKLSEKHIQTISNLIII